MKKITLIISFLFALNLSDAQTPNWQWVRSAAGPTGGSGSDIEGWLVAADGSGNAYVAGRYSDSVTFGSTLLTNTSGQEVYLVKYDNSGNVLWAAQSNSSAGSFPEPRGIATDAAGNVYVTGIFGPSFIAFGSITLSNAGGGNIDMFLIKYDPNGTPLWGKRIGGTGREWGESVAVDANDNVFVTGSFESASITIGTSTLVNALAPYEDVYLVKYDANGNFLWAKSSGGDGDEWGTSVECDDYGNVFISGPYQSSILPFGTDTLFNPYPNYQVMFVAKYDDAGNFKWAKQVTSTQAGGTGYWYDIVSDAFGNITVVGEFWGDTAYVGTNTLINPYPSFSTGMLIVKYDTSGNILWAHRANCVNGGNVQPMAITTDASGNSYVAGFFDCDSIFFNASTVLNINQFYYSDYFLVKYNASGNILWTKDIPGGYLPGSWGYAKIGITSNPARDIFMSACFQYDSIPFDADTAYMNYAWPNIFIAKLNDAGACGANFSLYPDTSTLHHYWAVNNASGTPPLTYDWNWGDGSPHDNIAFPSHTYASAGYYTICLTISDAASCTNMVCQTNNLQTAPHSSAPPSMVTVNVVSSIPTGVGENRFHQNAFYISPNPATTELAISSSDFGDNSEITICNVLGKEVFSETSALRTQTHIIDISLLSSGIYFIKVRDNKQEHIAKFIKL